MELTIIWSQTGSKSNQTIIYTVSSRHVKINSILICLLVTWKCYFNDRSTNVGILSDILFLDERLATDCSSQTVRYCTVCIIYKSYIFIRMRKIQYNIMYKIKNYLPEKYEEIHKMRTKMSSYTHTYRVTILTEYTCRFERYLKILTFFFS